MAVSTVSERPPTYPAMRPSAPPMRMPMATAPKLTAKECCPP